MRGWGGGGRQHPGEGWGGGRGGREAITRDRGGGDTIWNTRFVRKIYKNIQIYPMKGFLGAKYYVVRTNVAVLLFIYFHLRSIQQGA